MKRPSRLVLVTASLTVVGLLVGGTAYAMSSRGDAETYRACVNNRTGAIRMLLDGMEAGAGASPHVTVGCRQGLGPDR